MKVPLCWCNESWACKYAQILLLSPKKVFLVCMVTCTSTMVTCMWANGKVLVLTFSFVFLATFIQTSASGYIYTNISTTNLQHEHMWYLAACSCGGMHAHVLSGCKASYWSWILTCVQQTIRVPGACNRLWDERLDADKGSVMMQNWTLKAGRVCVQVEALQIGQLWYVLLPSSRHTILRAGNSPLLPASIPWAAVEQHHVTVAVCQVELQNVQSTASLQAKWAYIMYIIWVSLQSMAIYITAAFTMVSPT